MKDSIKSEFKNNLSVVVENYPDIAGYRQSNAQILISH
jgi:hypothetical protein